MEKQKFEKQKDWMVRSAAALVIVSALTALAACVAAIPAAVVYYEDKHRYTATADVEASATNVYAAADQVVKADASLDITKKDDKDLLLEAKKGSQFVSIKAAALPGSKTRLVVIADRDVKAADQTLAVDLVKRICDRLGVTYTLVKS
jgi:alpha/beta superfamily hydrolase